MDRQLERYVRGNPMHRDAVDVIPSREHRGVPGGGGDNPDVVASG